MKFKLPQSFSTKLQKLNHFFLKLIIFCFIFICFSAKAQNNPALINLSTEKNLQNQEQQAQDHLDYERQRLVNIEKLTNNLIKERDEQWQLILSRGITLQDVSNSQIALTDSKSALDNISISSSSANEELNTVLQMEQAVNQENLALETESSLERIKQVWKIRILLKSIISLLNQRLDVISQERRFASERLALVERWNQQLSQLYSFHLQQKTQANLLQSDLSLEERAKSLNQQLAQLSEQLLTISLNSPQANQQKAELQFEIFVTRERITVNEIALMLLKLRSSFRPVLMVDSDQVSMLRLQQNLSQVNQNDVLLSSVIDQIKNKIKFIDEQKKILAKNLPFMELESRLQSLVELGQAYQAQLIIADDFQSEVKEYQKQLNDIRTTQISMRQSLRLGSFSSWKKISVEFLVVPTYIWHSLEDTIGELAFELNSISKYALYGFVISVCFLLIFWVNLRKFFLKWLSALEAKSKRFSRQVLAITLRLIRQNLGIILFSFFLLIIEWVLGVEITFWISVTILILIYRLIINLARIWLLESEENINGRDVKLYRGLKKIFILGIIFSILLIISHLYPIGFEIRLFSNKMLMILLFALSILLLKSASVLPPLIQKAFSVRRTYVIRTIRILCIVVPITLLTNSIIGIVGYIQLAWVVGKYQIIALATLTLYMIIRGLFIDFMDFINHHLIAKYRSGWLWTQVFANPFDFIIRFLLLVGAFLIFLYWSQLFGNPSFRHYYYQLMHLPLFNLFGNIITLPILIKSIFLIALLYWVAKWSREFAFRWLYVKSTDIGLRNSLSIFTQYAVVVAGVMMALRILGFDLTGFAVVAAAFAAGIGLSLRDVATNFISGVLLLLERPLRTGDTITLGDYEGEVVSTGMRSMKIRTWDRMELIVPNADMFTKPFINWTHQDSIVRSVIKLKINRVDNPHFVQRLILDLFTNITSVVLDPVPEVFMKGLDEALIEFEIRYFINLQIQDSRPRVRSEVLFAIWDCFQKHGIQSPETEQRVRLLKGVQDQLKV